MLAHCKFLIKGLGLSSKYWGKKWLAAMECVRKDSPQEDLLCLHGVPMSYAVALGQFCKRLSCHGHMDANHVADFILHSLKATLLSGAGAAGVAEADRAAQGHHRSPNASGCIAKYNRGDVQPQLRCQKALLAALHKGWIPKVRRWISTLGSGQYFTLLCG